MNARLKITQDKTGFTLIETLIGMAIFAVIALAIYFTYLNIVEAIAKNRLRSAATAILEREIETVRGMKFSDVGLLGGAPAGLIASQKTVEYGAVSFLVDAYVRNIDDPFDGTTGGAPNDTAPADYKLVEFKISCLTCIGFFVPMRMTTTVAPAGLESATQNGSLFVNVFDSSGESVSGTIVKVVNNTTSPPISITDSTNANGLLQLVDVPTSTSAYEITVTKPGYTSARTYQLGDPQNPNPSKPHATVVSQQVTTLNFSIDVASSIAFISADETCAPVSGVEFSMEGSNIIGTDPVVKSFTTTTATNVSGTKLISLLEADTFTVSGVSSSMDIAGQSRFSPITTLPGSALVMRWLMAPKEPNALMVSVTDASSALLEGATVTLTRPGFSETKVTGRKEIVHSDWSGVGGYSSQSGEILVLPGEMQIGQVDGVYATGTEHWLEGPSIDFGTTTTSFFSLRFAPETQPAGTSVGLQLAANNDNVSWNYLGPDGTAGTYYTASGTAVTAVLNNNRYMRYRIVLQTDDASSTPSFNEMAIDYASGCITPGQAFFTNLTDDTYALAITRAGYQNYSDPNLDILQNWQSYSAILQP